jgi:hypothetical protein
MFTAKTREISRQHFGLADTAVTVSFGVFD